MPSYHNEHVFFGHLGADARIVELPPREGQSRSFVANFRVAATKRYSTRSGDRKERTTWFNVKLTMTSINGFQFFNEKLKKGAYVLVKGEPLVDEKVDDNAGGMQYYHYVRADIVEILAEAKTSAEKTTTVEADEEEVPPTRCSQMDEVPAPSAAPSRAPAPTAPAPRPAPASAPPPPLRPPAQHPQPQQHRQQPQPNVQPHRVHELPADAHTRFDTADF